MNEATARKIAAAIKDRYTIGEVSHFCDEVDFDPVGEDEIVEIILEVCGVNP